ARVNGGRIIPSRLGGIWQTGATTPSDSASKVTNRLICRSNNPIKVELVLNPQNCRGATCPLPLLARADEAIE
ncbi:MAG TPA: hypothetical protein VNO87_07655, partial [Methylomirabilota bacterium]|nr:hypothetical protein [Methylomirabilota bacterium]